MALVCFALISFYSKRISPCARMCDWETATDQLIQTISQWWKAKERSKRWLCCRGWTTWGQEMVTTWEEHHLNVAYANSGVCLDRIWFELLRKMTNSCLAANVTCWMPCGPGVPIKFCNNTKGHGLTISQVGMSLAFTTLCQPLACLKFMTMFVWEFLFSHWAILSALATMLFISNWMPWWKLPPD